MESQNCHKGGRCNEKMAMLLFALLLLPAAALAELNAEVKSADQACFPELHELTAYFQEAEDWIFVTPENLDEHLDMVLARGGTEEEIRQRYAWESFVFEAYSPLLDARECVRLERFENDMTRDIWHCRHMTLEQQEQFFEELEMGFIMPWYDTYSPLKRVNTQIGGYVTASFTSIPPTSLERAA